MLPADRIHQGGRAGAGGQGGGQRLAGAKLQTDILEAARREPPQGVRDEQRKRHPQRKVGPVQIEPDHDGLDAPLVHRIDQRRQIRFYQRASAPQGPDSHRLLDRHLGQIQVAHDWMVSVPVHDRRVLDLSLDLQRQATRHRVHEQIASGGNARDLDPIDDRHVELGLLLQELGAPGLYLHLRVCGQGLFQKRVPRTHEQDVERAWRGQNGQGLIVHREVVVNADGGLEDAAFVIHEGENEGALELRRERDPFCFDGPAGQREREVERHCFRGEIRHRKERLVVERPKEGFPGLEGRDADVPAAGTETVPVDRRATHVGHAGRFERPVGEHLDGGGPAPHLQVRLGEAERLWEPPGDVERGEAGEAAPERLAIVGERDHHLRVLRRGDEHGLLARSQRGDGGSDGGLGRRKTRAGDIGRLHAGRHVEDEDGALVPGDQHGADGPRERQGQEQDGQDLQQQEQGRLQPAEGGARLLVPQAVRPEESAAHQRLATTDLEQMQEDDGWNAQQEEERRRIEKAHRRNPPRRR